jgi:outer membrane protein assembly factor BamB
LASVLSAFATSSARAEDWPQWQGAERNAISKETGLLQEWPEDGPPLAWKIKGLGGGDGAPAVAAGRIYGMSNRGDEEVVWALSEADGKEAWVSAIGPAHRQDMPQSKDGPACTPTVDGDRVYVMGLGGELACLQASDGKIIWRRNLTRDFGGQVPPWSYRESPLVDGDRVIVTPGGTDVTLAALDKLTGEPIWKTHVPDQGAGGPGAAVAGAPGGAPGGRGPGGPGGPGGMPDLMQFMPVLKALDADGNREISVNEMDAAPDVLAKLDKNKDGKLVADEVVPDMGNRGGGARDQGGRQGRPQGGPGGRGGPGGPGGPGGMLRWMPIHAALDADESGEIDAAEIKDAAATLRKLDGNNDGKLVQDEVAPRFGGPRGGGGGGGFARSGAAYVSAIAIDFEGQRQYVQLTAKALVGVAATDGKVLWRYDRAANGMGINCSTPVYHDGMLFASSAYGAGGGLVKLSKGADGAVKAEEVYFTRNMQNHHGGMVVIDGYLYGADGGNEGGYLACLDFKTGKVLWHERDEERAAKGSVAVADGRLYYRVEDGSVLLVEPSPKEFIERGRFEQPDRTRQPAWAHPVVANGKLYIRDQDTLFCYDVKAK